MTRKRTQVQDGNTTDFKKVKLESSSQETTKHNGFKNKKRKKKKDCAEDSHAGKLSEEKISPHKSDTYGKENKGNLKAKSPLEEKGKKRKFDESRDRGQADIQEDKKPDGEKSSSESKKTGKKLNKWQRHKMKKAKVKSGKEKTERHSKQTTKEHNSAKVVIKVNPGDVSSNWNNLQQELGLQTKKKKVKHENLVTKEATKEEKEPEIWFHDVDEILLERKTTHQEKCTSSHNPLVKTGSYAGLTKILAMDCEMVGVGREGRESMLARVSIVNQHGHCVYDQFVKPIEEVVDYRTKVSGIRKQDLEKGREFSLVQKEVSSMIKGRLLVGHAIHHDLQVLYIGHPKKQIRDTARYKYFRQLSSGRTPSLKKLSSRVLGVSVQEGEHNSIQDAQATMRLYTMYRTQWEKEIKEKSKTGKPRNRKKIVRKEGKVEKEAKQNKTGSVIPSSLLD